MNKISRLSAFLIILGSILSVRFAIKANTENTNKEGKTNIYAEIEVQDGRRYTLRTDFTVIKYCPNLDPSGRVVTSLDASWWEGEDGYLIICTGEGTSHLSIRDGYIYEGWYRDGQCWNVEWVGGEEGSDEGGLDDVGYYPEPSKGEKLTFIKFYRNRDEYEIIEKQTKIIVDANVLLRCVLMQEDGYYRYKNPEDVEKCLEELGFSLYSRLNIEVEIGTDEPAMFPGLSNIFTSPSACIIFKTVKTLDWNDITSFKILFNTSEAKDVFIDKLKKDGWEEHEPLSCDARYYKNGFAIYFEEYSATFDDGH